MYQFYSNLSKSKFSSKKTLLALLLFFVAFNGYAQENSEVTVINASQFGVTRPLSEIFAENPVPDDFSIPKAEHPDKKNREPQKFPLAKGEDPVYGNDLSTLQREIGTEEAGTTKASWTGQTGTGRPFDPSGAVGPSHYIQMINATVFKVYNKTGTTLLTGTLGNLWSPAVGNYGDPVVMYDKPANRWFLAQFGSANEIYIAVSQTSNPLGAWYTYTYISPQFPDYLKFGIWHDAYYMTSNQGTQKVYAFNRAEMLAGTPGARSIYINYSPPKPTGFFCPLPADAGDGTLPPPGTPCPILSYSDNGWGAGFTDAVNIYNMSVNWVPVTPTATITLAGTVPTAAFNANYNPSWLDCPQPGTTQKLDGIGGVLMYRSQWKSWPGYNTMVLNWGVEISATQRGIKWCELRQTGGVWSMYQEGIFTPGADTRWMGSIAMNDQGSIGMCYMRSNSTTMYPSLYYTGRRTCDPLGTLPVTESVVGVGTGYQDGFPNPNADKRVGDYAHMTIDPSNGTTFWATSEFFGGTSGTGAARTQIFSFDITPCVVLTAGVTISISSGSNPTCGSANVTFVASPANGGSAPSYQWQVNGVNVGLNSANYSSSSLVAGDVVTCVMTSNLPGVTGNPATSNAITMSVSSPPTLGTAVISSLICLGSEATITYTEPSCDVDMGFQETYAPANWTLAQSNSNGSVNTASAPGSISMVSSNGLSGAGTTSYSITVPCAGNVTFNWAYTTIDGSTHDYPTYSINGGAPAVFTGYLTGGGSPQSGTMNVALNAGDILSLNAYSDDNLFGPCTIVISNFFGPALPYQHFDIFDAATGGYLIGYASITWTTTPNFPGPITYYVAAHDNGSGCYSTSRYPVTVQVAQNPTLGTATISPATICEGESTTITYTAPLCETVVGFQSVYDPLIWTTTQLNSNGTVNTSAIPYSITMVSSDGFIGSGYTDYSVTVSCAGNITFDWNYSTVDGPVWDYPQYLMNAGTPQFLPGYSTSGGSTQNGTASIPVNANDVFTLRIYSVDNGSGSCTTVYSNFTAPTASDQHFDVFNDPVAGSQIGLSYGSTLTLTPFFTGTTTYYVAAHSNSVPYCRSTTRIPLSVTVNPLPVLGTISTVSSSSCVSTPIQLQYNAVTCATSQNFEGVYAPANWNLVQTNSNGSVITSTAPNYISMVSSNGLSGPGTTQYSIIAPCTGTITFDWSYTTLDGAQYDYPSYSINGGPDQLFTGYNLALGSNPQTGTMSIPVNANDVFTLEVHSTDNLFESCNVNIYNFVAPVLLPPQSYYWYDAATGGSIVGFGSTLNYIPTLPGSYTFYVEVFDNNCLNPSRVASNTFVINALPNVTATGANICIGSSTTLTANGANSYTWNPGALVGSSVTVSPTISTVYTVVGIDGNGCVNSTTLNIYVHPNPILGVASATPASICLGASTSLNYVAPPGLACNGGYQSGFAGIYAPANWTLTQTNSNGSVDASSAPASITLISGNNGSGLSGTTDYTILMPCSGIVTFNWSYTTVDGAVFDYPRYSINGGAPQLFSGYNTSGGLTQSGTQSIQVAAGDVLNLQSYTADNGFGSCSVVISNFFAPQQTPSVQNITWYTAASGGSILGSGSTLSHTPSASGPFTYYAQVTNSSTGCINPTRKATNVLTVNALPIANAGSDKSLNCTTPSATIGTAPLPGHTYSWSPATGLTASNIAVPTCSATTTTTYTVTITSTSSGCTATDVVIVVVNKTPPTADAGADKTLTCTTASSTIGTAAISGNTYAWSPATALSAANIAVPTTTAATTTTYTVTVTNTANGCTATDAVLVTVNKTPPTADAGVDKTLTCTTASSTIGTAAISGNTYAWSPATALSAANIAVPTTTAATTTTYTVTVTNTANGCTATDAVLVTVNKTPPTADAGVDKTLTCTTASSTIGTAAVSGNTYAWSPATALSAANIAVPTTTAATTTTYTVTVTNTANGCTATDAVLVTVNKTPPTANAGADKTLTCTTASSTIGTAAISGNTYAWSPATALSAANIAVPTTTAATTTTYTVTVTNTANGCTATDAVLVTVNKTPPTADAGVDKTLTCTTASSTIGTAAVSGNTYAWSPATALSAANIAVPTTTAAATTTYTVTVTNTTNGCTATDAVLVTVNKTPPTVGTTATATSIACGASTSITGTGALTYTWQPGSLSGTTITVSPTTTTVYTVTGTAANGCSGVSTRLITVGPCGGSIVNVKLFIEGYYVGGSLMNPALLNSAIPGATPTQSDTITVELRNPSAPYALAASQKRILNTNGTSTGSFGVSGNFYIVIKHRNAVETWSANPVSISGTTTYDFSNLASKAYASNQVLVSPGVYALYSGDINQDLSVDAFDYVLLDPDLVAGAFGYLPTDINGDGSIDAFDYVILDVNIISGITSFAP